MPYGLRPLFITVSTDGLPGFSGVMGIIRDGPVHILCRPVKTARPLGAKEDKLRPAQFAVVPGGT
jgi:hypothetical protein